MREMKDSGIQWIGKIPLEWMIVSTKFLFTIMSGATPESTKPQNWDGNIKWITPADYKTKDIYVGDGRRNLSQTGFDSCSTNMVPKGSIIFSKRAPIGSVAISSADLCTNQGCLSCITKGTTFVKFYYYVMSIATEQYELLGSGTTFKEISAQSFSKSTHNRRKRPIHGHRGGSRGRFYYRITTFEERPWDARDPHKTTFMALK